MNIEEAKIRKEELEKQITDSLKQFEEVTGMRILSINPYFMPPPNAYHKEQFHKFRFTCEL